MVAGEPRDQRAGAVDLNCSWAAAGMYYSAVTADAKPNEFVFPLPVRSAVPVMAAACLALSHCLSATTSHSLICGSKRRHACMHELRPVFWWVAGSALPAFRSLSAVAEIKGEDGIWNGAFRETHMQVALDRPAGS